MQSNDRSPSGRRPGAWLRAALRPGEISTEVGWMGGNPRLPDGFEWPTRNSRPYVFLCQINCACLPAEIWDGRGPRTGWLAFFSEYLAGRADMRVIHAPDLGPERRNDEAWVKDVGPLYRIDSTFERFIGSPVSWPLEIVRPADGKSARPPRLRQRPGSSEEKLVAAPEHRPFDWDTLELLLLDAVHSAHQQLDRLANSVRQQEADMLPPPAELPAAYDELRRMNERLGMALAAWNPARPFNFASWMSHADFLVPIRQLHFEIELQSDGDFHRLTNYHVFEHFVYPGHPPAYFPPESPQGRHHAELHRRVDELREKFEADPAIPRKDGKISRDDKAGWKKFRAEFPGAWARYAEEVRQLRYQQIQFWAENAVAVVGRLGKDADGWMPKDITHDGALQRALAGRAGQSTSSKNSRLPPTRKNCRLIGSGWSRPSVSLPSWRRN